MATALVTVDTILKAVQGVIGGLAGIRKAPDYPPEKIGGYPFALLFVSEGECKWTAKGFITNLPNLVLQIHWPLKNVARDTEAAMPFLELVLKALFDDPQISATISAGAIQTPITYTFGDLGYFEIKTIGWEFIIPIKTAGDTA